MCKCKCKKKPKRSKKAISDGKSYQDFAKKRGISV